MKNYKVGDRVWFNHNKEYVKVVATPPIKGIVICQFDNGQHHKISIDDLHETADSMFEALGYEKEEDLKNDRIIYRWRDSLETIFSLKEKEMWLERIGDMSGEYILEIKEHQAIHQKLIELGWIE